MPSKHSIAEQFEPGRVRRARDLDRALDRAAAGAPVGVSHLHQDAGTQPFEARTASSESTRQISSNAGSRASSPATQRSAAGSSSWLA